MSIEREQATRAFLPLRDGTLAAFAEFHAQSLRAEGCHNSYRGGDDSSRDGKRQPVIQLAVFPRCSLDRYDPDSGASLAP